MTPSDLPDAPDFDTMQRWAGPGRVIRAAAADVESWRLPSEQKQALISCGVPLVEGILGEVRFDPEPHHGRYRLAQTGDDQSEPGFDYLAEPGTGVVSEHHRGELRFVNSSINHWLCSLHLIGTYFATSTAIHACNTESGLEDLALAELADLLGRIRQLDPAAYGDVGDHSTHFWPAVLDRWLF